MPHSLSSFLLGHQLITCILKCLLLSHKTLKSGSVFFFNLFYPLLFIEKISIDLTSNSLTACSRPCVYMSQRSGSDLSKIYTKNLWFHLLSEIPPHFLVAMVTTNCPLVLPDRKTVGFPLEFQLPNVALNVTA